MSIQNEAEACPSRVVGAYRYLLRARGRSEGGDSLEQLLMPSSLLAQRDSGRSPRAMIRNTIKECVAMGLLIEEDGRICFNETLPDNAIDSNEPERQIPLTLTDLILSQDIKTNHDFALVLAWFLSRDVRSAPGNWETFEPSFADSFPDGQLQMNNARFGQFRLWARYLGFVWFHNHKKHGEWMVPDPTNQIRWRLSELFGDSQLLTIGDFMERLAMLCPVFEGGTVRTLVEERVGLQRDQRLSSVTAHALLRLDADGVLELGQKSDATALVLPDGDRSTRYSEVGWKAKRP